MNLVDATIKEIKGEPYQPEGYDFWCIDLVTDCYGRINQKDRESSKDKDRLLKLKVGDTLLR